jgi:antibiotic biosynthesis monooxygenase (ABM) superfamily enzyme
MTKLNNEPVSVVLSRTVKIGKEQEYEKLAHEAITASRKYTGHAGTTVIKEGQRRYHLVYRFTNHEKLDEWLASPQRRHIRTEINKLTEDNSDIQKLTGFETWFKVPGQSPQNSPPRIKMWIATLLSVYPLVLLFQILLAPKVRNWPLPLRAAIFPVVLLTLMMFVVMPQVTKILRPWLYKGLDNQGNNE